MADVEAPSKTGRKKANKSVAAKKAPATATKKAGKSVGTKKAVESVASETEKKAGKKAGAKKSLAVENTENKSAVTYKGLLRRAGRARSRLAALGESPLHAVSHARLRSMTALYNVPYLDKTGSAALRRVADSVASEVIDLAIIYAEHGRRKTMTKHDVAMGYETYCRKLSNPKLVFDACYVEKKKKKAEGAGASVEEVTATSVAASEESASV